MVVAVGVTVVGVMTDVVGVMTIVDGVTTVVGGVITIVVGVGVVVVAPGVVVGVGVVVVGLVVVVAGLVVVVAGLVVVVAGVVVVVVVDDVDDVVVDDVVVVPAAAHPGLVMTLESRVTEPLRARRRPATRALVFAVIEVNARIVPTNLEPTPSVAELPTCQNTLHGWAPLMTLTLLLTAVVSEVPVWKMNTAPASP
ncbi:MAG TPA: hypothetical protein VMZ22_03225 [Acidimicrobiales bacterium]|nr:hypothetical protein [Acidimicrobiales bacterium]